MYHQDNHNRDNDSSRIHRTAANPWGAWFAHYDWRGRIQHDWHTDGEAQLNAEQVTNLLRSNPLSMEDYNLIKKNIVFQQIEVYNMELELDHFKQYIQTDQGYIDNKQKLINKKIDVIIEFRTNICKIPNTVTDPVERNWRRNNIINGHTSMLFDMTLELYEMKIQRDRYITEMNNLIVRLNAKKQLLTSLVRAVLDAQPDYHYDYDSLDFVVRS